MIPKGVATFSLFMLNSSLSLIYVQQFYFWQYVFIFTSAFITARMRWMGEGNVLKVMSVSVRGGGGGGTYLPGDWGRGSNHLQPTGGPTFQLIGGGVVPTFQPVGVTYFPADRGPPTFQPTGGAGYLPSSSWGVPIFQLIGGPYLGRYPPCPR